MRNIIQWMKTNPISVASGVVAVLSIGVIAAVYVMGSDLKTKMDTRAKDFAKISGLENTNVTVMAPVPRSFSVTANPTVVAQVMELNQKYDKEFALLQKEAPMDNAAGHELLREGVLPERSGTLAPTEFKSRYTRGVAAMLSDVPSETLPRLQAGMPRAMGEINLELEQFKASYFPPSEERLNEEQQEDMVAELEDAVKVKLEELLADSALRVKIYAQTEPQAPDFPLPIRAWAYQTSLPEDWQVFEGQMEFWILQDVLQAIELANADATNVTESPVKHLHRLEIDNGYVGFQTVGLVPTTPVIDPTAASGRSSRSGGGRSGAENGFAGNPGLGLVSGGEGTRGGGGRAGDGATPFTLPMSEFQSEVTGALSDNFHAGLTGHVSNPMYVVRHVKLVVTLESRAGLSKLVESINQVNLMTVLNIRMEDVDEYQRLYEGFVYGPDDVITAEVIIETIWFTSWLKQYMPDLVKQYMGVEEAGGGEAGGDGAGGFGGGFGGGFDGGFDGGF